MPWRTMPLGSWPVMAWPPKSMRPAETRPSSVLIRFEMAFSVVLLPAPLAPSSVTQEASGTLAEMPLTARMTSLYSTSTLLSSSTPRSSQ